MSKKAILPIKTFQSVHNRISIITLGCSKNTVDSEVLAGHLMRSGFQVQWDEARPADIVIINTCGFIGDAKQESVDTILHFLRLKEEGRILKVFVMGCLIQRYMDEIRAELPGMDGCFGVSSFGEILHTLKGKGRLPGRQNRVLSTPSHYAFLKISEGCDRRCSFCAIPGIRGTHVSRTLRSLMQEASDLAGMGVKELNIIAQDTTSYGLDLSGKRMLAPLLEKLADSGKFEWIRLHYTYPAGFPTDLPDIIARYPAICNYIDMPLQHISERILSSMKRGITAAATRKLLDRIRARIPGVAIRTAFITGYPGETRKEFNELMRFVKEQRFDRMGAFEYSDEEGTAAFLLPDKVSRRTIRSRAGELMALQQEISAEKNRMRIGSTLRVLVDRTEGEFYIGRTEFDSPEVDNEVLIPLASEGVAVGDFCTVLIQDADEFDLYGEPVG